MKREFDLAIIGGGSAGLLAAQVAPKLGLRAALIERSRLGGDCLWTGCVPSKALLASAKAAHILRNAGKYGLPAHEPEIDTAAVWRRIREIQESIAAGEDSPEAVRDGGADVIFGEATLADAHTVRVGERTLTARYILICTGSRPATPPIDGLQDVGFLSSENLFQQERAPDSLLIVGGGPIGVEMAQAMNRLGVKVTLLEMAGGILARDEPTLTALLTEVLRDEGVDVQTNVQLLRASLDNGGKVLQGTLAGEERSWSAAEILVTAGRTPNIDSLRLDDAGVRVGPRGIIVDKKLRSSVKSVYAVGDCAGRFLFTHTAGAETAAALRNMFYPGTQDAPEIVPWTTFTDPELAHVGMTSDEARAARGEDQVRVYERDIGLSDRGRAESAPPGRVIVVADTSHKILGAHILAPPAGEMIGQFTLAMAQGIKLIPAFRDLIQVYPTFSTGLAQLTEDAVYEQLDRPLYRAARRLNDLLGD